MADDGLFPWLAAGFADLDAAAVFFLPLPAVVAGIRQRQIDAVVFLLGFGCALFAWAHWLWCPALHALLDPARGSCRKRIASGSAAPMRSAFARRAEHTLLPQSHQRTQTSGPPAGVDRRAATSTGLSSRAEALEFGARARASAKKPARGGSPTTIEELTSDTSRKRHRWIADALDDGLRPRGHRREGRDGLAVSGGREAWRTRLVVFH